MSWICGGKSEVDLVRQHDENVLDLGVQCVYKNRYLHDASTGSGGSEARASLTQLNLRRR